MGDFIGMDSRGAALVELLRNFQYDPVDANVEEMFNRLVRLLEDEVLYSGLKPEPASLPADSSIRVITDVDFAISIAFDQQSPEFTGEYAEDGVCGYCG